MRKGNQTAIVTGASRGIGAAIARRLASDGYNVVVNFSGSTETAEALVDDIKRVGGSAIAFRADVAAPADVNAMFDRTVETFGGVDVVVNNAGVAIRKPIAEFSDDDFDRLLGTKLKGVFNVLREAALRVSDGGRIVNITASFQGAPIPGYGPYAASKMAIEKLTEVAAKELGVRSIRVNAVRPGPTNTDLFNSGKTEEVRNMFAQQHALGRIGEPEDVAGVVAFLVGDDANWVTGQMVGANGGYW